MTKEEKLHIDVEYRETDIKCEMNMLFLFDFTDRVEYTIITRIL